MILNKRKKQSILLGILAIVLISSIIGYNYYIDQIKIKGFIFGNNIKQIQDELKKLHEEFEDQKRLWNANEISKQDFIDYAQKEQIPKLESLILQYSELDTPPPFISSVEFFKLSTESQIESTKEFILWLETGDMSHKIRSDELFQESFEHELIALSNFKASSSSKSP